MLARLLLCISHSQKDVQRWSKAHTLCGRHYYLVNCCEIFVSQITVITIRPFLYWQFITWFAKRVTRRVPLVEQKLVTLPGHLSSPPLFSGIRIVQALVSVLCFVNHRFSSLFLVIVLSVPLRLIDGFWLPLGILKLFVKCIILVNVGSHQFSTER
jgi:hypothetical protein